MNMNEVFFGVFIFMAGCVFGMVLSGVMLAASREFPKRKIQKEYIPCYCGRPDLQGVHSTSLPCLLTYKENP